jgi:putative transposase
MAAPDQLPKNTDPLVTREPSIHGSSTTASEFIYVPTWSGTVYVAFVIDVFARRIVGWRASTSMKTQFVLDALDQAIWQRKTQDNKSLIHHSDRSSQYLSVKCTERLAEAESFTSS